MTGAAGRDSASLGVASSLPAAPMPASKASPRRFRQWSGQAQLGGHPDRIIFRLCVVAPVQVVKAVEPGPARRAGPVHPVGGAPAVPAESNFPVAAAAQHRDTAVKRIMTVLPWVLTGHRDPRQSCRCRNPLECHAVTGAGWSGPATGWLASVWPLTPLPNNISVAAGPARLADHSRAISSLTCAAGGVPALLRATTRSAVPAARDCRRRWDHARTCAYCSELAGARLGGVRHYVQVRPAGP